MTRVRTFLAWVAICFAFALVLVSTACPDDDLICLFRSRLP